MNWIIFWTAALATYRLTIFVARDRGPMELFTRIRRSLYLGTWAKCPFCVSPYAAALVAVLLYLAGVYEPLAMWILLVLAWSAITIALDRTFTVDVINN